MNQLNYRHLYYFWVVAKEGGIARAADRTGSNAGRSAVGRR
jgi:LysR family transcriptional activator of nhaA